MSQNLRIDDYPALRRNGHWRIAVWGLRAGYFGLSLWARHELPDPRPGYWSMRLMLIHDTVHARPSATRCAGR